MPVFDMDSHLREEYFLDEVYKLEGAFAAETPTIHAPPGGGGK